MPDWVKQNALAAGLFIVGMYVGLQTLEVKFKFQEDRATERYHVLLDINTKLEHTIKQVGELHASYANIEDRVDRVETYVPNSITELEKEVMMLEYKVDKGVTKL